MTPIEEFEVGVQQHFKPLAERLALRFGHFDDHLFILWAADISIHVYFFEPHSSPGYDVRVAIAPEHEPRRNPPDERGLVWFAQYLGVSSPPEDRIASIAEIPQRLRVLSDITDRVLKRVFSAGQEFWPPFYAFVQTEIAKIPEPAWMQNYKKGLL